MLEPQSLSTFQHRSFELADNGMVFTPQSDLVILNYIANYIIQNNAVNESFFKQHVNLRRGVTDIGYGLRPTHPLEKAAKNPGSDASEPMSFDECISAMLEPQSTKASACSISS